jgi:tetratricopeptide (TPR) repeat protein
MKKFNPIFFILLTILHSCGRHTAKDNPVVSNERFNDRIIQLANFTGNADSCRKALVYLDSLTAKDSNNFLSYYNQLMFISTLGKFDRAVSAINHCIRLSPGAQDLYLLGGVFYEKTGDTSSARKYFQQSLTIINTVLDTMSAHHPDYEMLGINKAINLIMLDDSSKGYALLRSVSKRQNDPEFKAGPLSFLKKNKKEIVDALTGSKHSQETHR